MLVGLKHLWVKWLAQGHTTNTHMHILSTHVWSTWSSRHEPYQLLGDLKPTFDSQTPYSLGHAVHTNLATDQESWSLFLPFRHIGLTVRIPGQWCRKIYLQVCVLWSASALTHQLNLHWWCRAGQRSVHTKVSKQNMHLHGCSTYCPDYKNWKRTVIEIFSPNLTGGYSKGKILLLWRANSAL